MADQWVVITDFDGTVTPVDVGDTLFQTYNPQAWEEAMALWLTGAISSKECLERECRSMRITPVALTNFACVQEIDPEFPKFVARCRAQGIPAEVVSDGLDFYIRVILQKYGLGELPLYANHLRFAESGEWIPEFPYYGQGCGHCGNCKRYHLERLKGRGRVIYVGNGLSDRCPAPHADLLFAKRDSELAHYCEQSGLPFVSFRGWGEISAHPIFSRGSTKIKP